jgi:hypothetical protein
VKTPLNPLGDKEVLVAIQNFLEQQEEDIFVIAFKFSFLQKKERKYNVCKYWSLNHLRCLFLSLLKL